MSKTVKTIIIIVCCVALVGGVFGILAGVSNGKFDSKKISGLAFSVGGLDSTGSYESTDASIYTKDAFECQGLTCTLDFDSVISYQVYFYDQNNDFVHTTGKLTGAFVSDSVPFFAKYARIVVTPNDDAKVSKLELLKYAEQITVKVYREQGFKNYTDNLIEKDIEHAQLKSTDGTVDTSDSTISVWVSKYINVSNYDECLMIRANTTMANCTIFLYDNTHTFVNKYTVTDVADVVFVTSEGETYYRINLSSLTDSDYTFIRTNSTDANPISVFCR
jgi:hypothetical protein